MSGGETPARCRDLGSGLLEALVAGAIAALGIAAALSIYAAAQRACQAGAARVEAQQSARVAFERIVADLRLAGFNINPDGDPSRTDEAIEGAWDTAITIRADFDSEDREASLEPETALAGPAQAVVPTANDEIVTYVLRKAGEVDAGHLDLRLDAGRPRSNSPQDVRVPNVAQVHGDPPYTLYRVTPADAAGAFPSAPQSPGDFVFEPVADGIRAIRFRYFDQDGVSLGPGTPDDPSDDIGGDEGGRGLRARIRGIEFEIVTMLSDEGAATTAEGPAGATREGGGIGMRTVIFPRSLGR